MAKAIKKARRAPTRKAEGAALVNVLDEMTPSISAIGEFGENLCDVRVCGATLWNTIRILTNDARRHALLVNVRGDIAAKEKKEALAALDRLEELVDGYCSYDQGPREHAPAITKAIGALLRDEAEAAMVALEKAIIAMGHEPPGYYYSPTNEELAELRGGAHGR